MSETFVSVFTGVQLIVQKGLVRIENVGAFHFTYILRDRQSLRSIPMPENPLCSERAFAWEILDFGAYIY